MEDAVYFAIIDSAGEYIFKFKDKGWACRIYGCTFTMPYYFLNDPYHGWVWENHKYVLDKEEIKYTVPILLLLNNEV